MNPIERLKADKCHEEWKSFFLVTSNIEHLEENTPSLRDIHLFVDYIDFLRERKHGYLHLYSAAIGSGLTVLLIAGGLGILGLFM